MQIQVKTLIQLQAKKLIQIEAKTLTLTTNANANGVGYSVIRERGGAGTERANT